MFVLLSANIVVLAVWTALAPLRVETEILAADLFDRAVQTHDYCYSDGMLPYIICLGVLNFAALFLAFYESYQAKGVPLEYSESKYIFRAMACMMLVCFIGIPIMVIAYMYENPSAFVFVFTGIIFVTASCTLLLIFVPKIRTNKTNESLSTASSTHGSSAGSSQSTGVRILSHQKNKNKLAEENRRLKEYVKASLRNLDVADNGTEDEETAPAGIRRTPPTLAISVMGEKTYLDESSHD
mmetsp:Transcript_35427/g.76860  ORF Transcript_35427/g.76860 Transcript_35427/m.76860 type:complete len:240 (+) Transcript_35427:755-1474(+)